MDEAMDDAAPEGSDFNDEQDEDVDKQEYVRKEFFARPYESDGVTEAAVNQLIVKPSRQLIRMRVSKPRREFGLENFTLIDKEAGETTTDLKFVQKNTGSIQRNTKRKVLQMGLQAANQMENLQTQTYFNRSVNAAVQYMPSDFIDKIRGQTSGSEGLNEKLDKFIDRVGYRIEEALQSNEIINVFQDDFEMLGDEEAAASKQISTVNMVPRAFYEQEYCKDKVVSCIKFHPTKPHLVAMSLVEHLSFEARTEKMNKSHLHHVLILNFSDAHIITLNYILQTPVEVTVIEFHPENPNVLVGGGINGQVLAWDIASPEHRITGGKKATVAKMPDEETDKTQQVAVKLK